VEGDGHATFELQGDVLGRCGRVFDGLGGGIDVIGNNVLGGLGFAPTDGYAPHAFVDRVSFGRCVDFKAKLFEVLGFLESAPTQIANGRDDFELGRDGTDNDIEANLVVPRAGRAVNDRFGV